MAKKSFSFEEIKSKVSYYISTPNGRIGVILPNKKPTKEDLRELYEVAAEIIIRSSKAKDATKV